MDETQEQPGGKKSWFEKLIEEAKSAAKIISGSPRVIKLIWETSPGYMSLMILLSLILGMLPLANLWVSKAVVDLITEALTKPSGFSLSGIFAVLASAKVLPLLAIMALLELSGAVIRPCSHLIESRLGDKLSEDINERILRKAISFVDIQFFETSKFYDSLQKAEQEAGYRPMHMLRELMDIFRSLIQLFAVAISFLIMQPILCLTVLAFSLPALVLQIRHNRESWSTSEWEMPEARRMHYFKWTLTDKYSAAEIRLFGLGEYFLDRYKKQYREFSNKKQGLKSKQWRQSMALGIMATVSDMGAYSLLVMRAVTGGITLGSFYFYSSALSQIQSTLSNLINSTASLYEDNLFINNLFEFLEMKPTMVPPDPAWAFKAPKPIIKGIEFRNVKFSYAGAEREILSGLSFKIEPGQTVALVGENGAGKTTIVKLLGRLYDPSEGEILIDGIDLKEIDLDNWRQQIAVIFQDFASYQLTAGENIGIGQQNFIDDEIRIKAAAERGGATAVIEKLPKKFDTMLGRWFGMKDEASDLSGGEWQKIALSRAFMRAPQSEINGNDEGLEAHQRAGAAQVLVLDEPTASLDAQSEYDIYQRFKELTRGKMTFLISHRFSTVKMANLILVMEHGSIVEKGSHEELMTLGGKYAHLYKLQAERYT